MFAAVRPAFFRPGVLDRVFGQGKRKQALVDTVLRVCFGNGAPPLPNAARALLQLVTP